jgi:hypothetical protein
MRDHDRGPAAHPLLMPACTMRALMTSFLVLVAASAARAESLVMLPPSGTNVSDGLLQAAGDVLRGHLVRLGRRVVVAQGAPGGQEPDLQAAAEQARAASTDAAVVLHVTRLGTTARLRLTVYGAGGDLRWVDELPAATPDDMHPVLERLARGYATRQPSARNADIETVTEMEGQPLRKRKATHTFGVQLGFLVPMGGDGDASAIPGAAIFWLYDARSFLAEINLAIHDKAGDGGVALGLGVYYPFQRDDVTPYLGGGLRWASLETTGTGGDGLQVYGAAGLLLGRLSSVQVRGELSYFANTFAESTGYEYYSSTSSPDSFHAHGVELSVGIGF